MTADERVSVVVVSDTSPLRAVGHLDLIGALPSLFDRVLVPPAVVQELSSPPAPFAPFDVSRYPVLEVRRPRDTLNVARLRQSLGPGEAEALALAEEVGATVVLIDERAGRATAQRLGLRPLGTLGILLRAKSQGLVVAVSPLVDRLVHELGFFVSADLRAAILREARE